MAKPLTFDRHSLGAFCYSASEMKVRYGKFVTNVCSTLAREKLPADDLELANILGFPAFSGPLIVTWKSKDGAYFSHAFELDDIFKDRLVLHKEDAAKIDSTLPLITPPGIIVEVNDKTLTLYMDSYIGLVTNEHGLVRKSSRNRLVVYQKTF